MHRPSRVPLILRPTPCHRLDRLSDELGVDVWIKRDDLTGFAGGGNKGRKLEFLLADALDQRADTVVSCGSVQSNFVRQLGAAAAMHGLRCVAAVMDLPHAAELGPPAGQGLLPSGGNVPLDRLVDVDLRVFPDGSWDDLFAHADHLARELESDGAQVYRIPVGGSSPLGAYGFVEASEELSDGCPFDALVVPVSSGSTYAGLVWGFTGTTTRVIGIACDAEPELIHEEIAAMLAGLDDLTGERKAISSSSLDYRLDWVGEAYGVLSDSGMAALHRLARTEGIFLDPIYSGKAFAGLLALIESGELTGRVLFWHTGGLPSTSALPH